MANDSKGYYKVFGIPAGSDISVVKRTYRKLQGELHPNGPARMNFRNSPEFQSLSKEAQEAKEKELDEEIAKVNTAYAVLGDEEKKKNYDTGTGEFAEVQGFQGGGFGGFEDLFGSFGRRQTKSTPKSETIVAKINITLKESFTGKIAKFKISPSKLCNGCSGKGYEKVKKCMACDGKGSVIRQQTMAGFIIHQQTIKCNKCAGFGYIPDGPACISCKGAKTIKSPFIVEVNVHPGIKEGEAIKFAGKGNHTPGCDPGDIIFKISIEKNPTFSRNGNDLIVTAKIDLLTALSGGILYFEHLDGRTLALKIDPIKNFKDCLKLYGEGFKCGNSKGDLYIDLDIQINKNLKREKLISVIPELISKPSGSYSTVIPTYSRMPSNQQKTAEDYEDSEDDFRSTAHSFFSGFTRF